MYILNNVETFSKETIERLFNIFKNDFINNKTYLKKGSVQYLIDVKEEIVCPCPFENGEPKPERFWHIITNVITNEKNNSKHRNPCPSPENKRRYDKARAKRIHWIKIIIDNWQNNEDIKYFYERVNGKETLHIWHTKKDFLVLIRKESNSSSRFLVSTFLIYKNRRQQYRKRLRRFEENTNQIDWFI
jgi:TusA-related sulfurtransferase